jgi:predicted bacteriocin transport accessory protein
MKKSENRKALGLLIFIGLFLLTIPVMLHFGSKKVIVVMEEYAEILEKEGNHIVYLGRPSCSYCQAFEPILKSLDAQYKFGYDYINTDLISSEQVSQILAKLGILETEFGTPYLVFMNGDKVIDEAVGYMTAENLFAVLKENNYVTGEYEKPEELINYVDYNEYTEVLKQDNVVLVVGQTTCSACIQSKPTLENLIKDNDIVINYLEYDLLSDAYRTNVADYLNKYIIPEGEESWFTPTMMIIKDEKVVDHLVGGYPQEEYEEFLRKNNIIE